MSESRSKSFFNPFAFPCGEGRLYPPKAGESRGYTMSTRSLAVVFSASAAVMTVGLQTGAPAAAANLITNNPSLNSPSIPSGTNNGPGTTTPYYTTTAGTNDWGTTASQPGAINYWWTVLAGVQYFSTTNLDVATEAAWMNGHGNGLIYQDVGALSPNTTYTLTVNEAWRNDLTSEGSPPLMYAMVNGTVNGSGNIVQSSGTYNMAVQVGGHPGVSESGLSGIALASGTYSPTVQGTFQTTPAITYTTGAAVSGDMIVVLLHPFVGGGTQADINYVDLEASAVPEPGAIALLGVAGIGLLLMSRRPVLHRKTA